MRVSWKYSHHSYFPYLPFDRWIKILVEPLLLRSESFKASRVSKQVVGTTRCACAQYLTHPHPPPPSLLTTFVEHNGRRRDEWQRSVGIILRKHTWFYIRAASSALLTHLLGFTWLLSTSRGFFVVCCSAANVSKVEKSTAIARLRTANFSTF